MSKILVEKKNDLITRAEELVKDADVRELTEDEARARLRRPCHP